jgi:hypothetical protein
MDLLQELDELIDTPSNNTPEDSRYLLELDYSTLYSTFFKRQLYWVLAMKAARQAGQGTSAISKQRGQRKHNTRTNTIK